MDKLTVAAEWRKYADEDLRSAQHMAKNMCPAPDHIICFLCQQSTEKYLKGFIILHDDEPERTHDLNLLCGLCKALDAGFVEIEQQCAVLTQYGVQPRYPFEIQIDNDDMTRALRFAETVQAFMRRIAPDMFAGDAADADR